MWDLNGNWDGKSLYGRWSVNLFIFKGSEMGNVTQHDDEEQISQVSGLARSQATWPDQAVDTDNMSHGARCASFSICKM